MPWRSRSAESFSAAQVLLSTSNLSAASRMYYAFYQALVSIWDDVWDPTVSFGWMYWEHKEIEKSNESRMLFEECVKKLPQHQRGQRVRELEQMFLQLKQRRIFADYNRGRPFSQADIDRDFSRLKPLLRDLGVTII